MSASICFFFTQLVMLAEGLLYPPTHPTLQQYSWLIMLLFEFACFVILFMFLPETRNRRVEDIVSVWVDSRQLHLAEGPAPVVAAPTLADEADGRHAPATEPSEATSLFSDDDGSSTNYRTYGMFD